MRSNRSLNHHIYYTMMNVPSVSLMSRFEIISGVLLVESAKMNLFHTLHNENWTFPSCHHVMMQIEVELAGFYLY